jgi:protein TonB
LILSLGVVIAFFEMPIEDTRQLVQLTGHMGELEEMQEIPPTEQKLPPPPVIKNPEIVAVADEEIIEMEIEVDFSMEANENTIVEHAEVVVKEEKPVKEDIDEIFQIVEEPAAPIGGYETFYAYVSSQLHYPRKALDMQVSGKVYVKFVVDRDGSLTQLEVVRGIGFGCDEEALRVLAKAPKWKPGKQRGRNVRQQMIIPIVFKLADM